MADALIPHLPCLLWLVPLLPLLAGAITAFMPNRMGRLASWLALGALLVSCAIAVAALACALAPVHEKAFRLETAYTWFSFGDVALKVGLVLDPLSAAMGAMVSFVAFWIFLYSTGYMKSEARFGRFFCFLSLFSGAMLLVVYSNSLLLLFMAWELVGLASYLLIGYYYEKPSAAAAAQKAFITTRIGDMAFFLGMIWLFGQTGTLLFFDHGRGLLETGVLGSLAGVTTVGGLTVSAAAALLLLVGAMGKSGQVPLHTWLPDAMEGPTPVSALIHAATMVAAGVFLVARTHPIFMNSGITGLPLTATAWIGGITALYAACVALGQNDIKRILAYSTVSQLGFMMVALGTGGVAAAMFHLIAHAFFKALLFLSAGSVIHGCHDEQDIRRMGGLKADMPLTFITYSIGMLALCGFPIFFSGFWSKDGILEAAQHWSVAKAPFYMLVFGALLTAFYMTRQVAYVFFDHWRGHKPAHESPAVMTVPLAILAFFAITLGALGTPVWPWFRAFLDGRAAGFDLHGFAEPGLLALMTTSTLVVFLGLGVGWRLYGNKSTRPEAKDALENAVPWVWAVLRDRFYVDELYGVTVIAFYAWWGRVADWLDRHVWGGAVTGVAWSFGLWARLSRFLDTNVVDGSFDKGCEELSAGGGLLSRVQSGRVQAYLRILALAVVALAAVLIWSARP